MKYTILERAGRRILLVSGFRYEVRQGRKLAAALLQKEPAEQVVLLSSSSCANGRLEILFSANGSRRQDALEAAGYYMKYGRRYAGDSLLLRIEGEIEKLESLPDSSDWQMAERTLSLPSELVKEQDWKSIASR